MHFRVCKSDPGHRLIYRSTKDESELLKLPLHSQSLQNKYFHSQAGSWSLMSQTLQEYCLLFSGCVSLATLEITALWQNGLLQIVWFHSGELIHKNITFPFKSLFSLTLYLFCKGMHSPTPISFLLWWLVGFGFVPFLVVWLFFLCCYFWKVPYYFFFF